MAADCRCASARGDETGDVANFDYQQITGPPSTYLGIREFGGTDYIGRWDGVFGSSWVAEAAFGTHSEEDKIGGPGKSIVHVIDQTASGSPTSGGFGFHQDQEFDRDVIKASVSKFVGDHEFKIGADEEMVSAVNANWNGGARLSNIDALDTLDTPTESAAGRDYFNLGLGVSAQFNDGGAAFLSYEKVFGKSNTSADYTVTGGVRFEF